MKIVVLGLSLSSSWGNGHATTWRALLQGVHELGHETLFLERRTPWYAAHQDLADPTFCRLAFYDAPEEIETRFAESLAGADMVIVGSYVPDGVAVIDIALRLAPGRVSFYDIDTPITVAALKAGRDPYVAPRQIPQFDVYFSFSGGPILDEIEDRFEARDARALYCCVDPARYAPTGETPRWDLGYLGTYSDDRQPVLEKLLIEPARRLPHMRFVVAGPQYPETIAWPANIERIDHLPPADHPAFYSAQRFTLNVTRADMARAGYSPSVRLFEAGACGAPIISDVWRGIDTLLRPEREILLASETDDVVARLTHMDEERRGDVAAAARARILAEHTGAARARSLLSAARPRDAPRAALVAD
ncbi:MAG TPA: glycosyltransferase [Beijerinckiaceae bacterium]|jgi:spore maturation protein CgeB